MTAATHRDWFGLDRFRPGPRFVRDGARCFLLEEVGSTSDFLLGRGEPATGRICEWDGWGWRAQPLRNLRAVGEARLGTVVVAHRQTAGRGRQGRGWTDCGGLHMSCVVPNHRADFELGFSVWLGLMVVLALRDDCGLDARTPFQFSGRGEVYSFTTVRDAPEGPSEQVPYTVALVRLEEGPLVTAQLTDLDQQDVEIGLPVEMVTRKLRSDGERGMLVYGYKFRPLLRPAA